MWPAAQIGKLSLCIKSNVAIFKVRKQVEFVFVSFILKILYGISFWKFLFLRMRYFVWRARSFSFRALQDQLP